mgnify:CR=1 FL=1
MKLFTLLFRNTLYRYGGGKEWARVGRIDRTPDVQYRRAWSMAVYRGRLFCGTLPSGRVHALEAGACATCDSQLAPGWHHLAAVRRKERLEIYVDGRLAGESGIAGDFDIDNGCPLTIGRGAQGSFNGRIRDVRLYARGLSAAEVERLSGE